MTDTCGISADHARCLTGGSIGSELLSLSWPILCTGIAEVLDGAVNVMWVGRELGDVSLAALSNANLFWGILFVGAFGITMAGTVWIGQSLGQGDLKSAKAAVGTMVTVSLAVSVVCILPVLIWPGVLIASLGTPPAARPEAVKYLQILLLSVPPTYLNASVIATLRATGDSRTGFYFGVVSVAIDAALNPLLIIGVSPFPALGIAGSAFATLAGQVTCLMALLVQLYRTRHPLRLLRKDLDSSLIDWFRAGRLLCSGGPMAVQVLWASIESMAMISLVNRFGADVTAGYGAVMQLWNLITMPAIALGVAITAIVARNVGAGRWDRVRSVAWWGAMYGVVATAALVAVVEVLGTYSCAVFLPAGAPSLSVALEINREATWSVILLGGYTVWVGVLRATGAVWAPLAIAAGVLAVRFPVTMALLGRWQAQAIWWSFPASAVATSVLAAMHAHFGARTRRFLLRGQQL